MLTNLSINTNITLSQPERKTLFPGNKFYNCKPNYILYITICNVKKLHDMGFRPKRLKLVCDENIIEKSKLIKIIKITQLKGIYPTYCFNEPKEHAGIFNGILTGQSEVYSLM